MSFILFFYFIFFNDNEEVSGWRIIFWKIFCLGDTLQTTINISATVDPLREVSVSHGCKTIDYRSWSQQILHYFFFFFTLSQNVVWPFLELKLQAQAKNVYADPHMLWSSHANTRVLKLLEDYLKTAHHSCSTFLSQVPVCWKAVVSVVQHPREDPNGHNSRASRDLTGHTCSHSSYNGGRKPERQCWTKQESRKSERLNRRFCAQILAKKIFSSYTAVKPNHMLCKQQACHITSKSGCTVRLNFNIINTCSVPFFKNIILNVLVPDCRRWWLV